MPSVGTQSSKAWQQQTEGKLPGQIDLNNLLTELLSGQLGQGVDAYQGVLAPGASDLQQQAFSQFGGTPENQGAFQGVIANLLGGGGYDPAKRAEVYKAQTDRSQREFMNQTIPQLMERFNAQGLGRSGGLERELAIAGGELGLRNRELNSMMELEDQARRQQSQGLGLQGFLGGQASQQTGLQNLLAAGGQQRGIAQDQAQAEYGRWEQGQAQNNPWLQLLGPAMGFDPYDTLSFSKGKQTSVGF